jgi:hypothetical protein
MKISEPITTPHKQAPLRWSPLIQLILSLLATILLLGVAAIIIIVSVAQNISSGSVLADLTQPFMVATSLAFAGVLVFPSAWYAWKDLSSSAIQPKPSPKPRNYTLLLTLLMLVVVGTALLLGNLVAQDERFAWFLLPPLNIIATGLPALWVIYIGSRGLVSGTPRRQWGAFASGLVVGPIIILVLELLLLFAMGLLALLWIMLNPSLSSQLNGIAFRLQHAAPNTEAVLRILIPFLVNPGIIFLLFAFISVFVPMLEEIFKPIGVWFMAGQKLTPAQGFGFGVLSGAGFGLFENLGNTSNGGPDWALLASSRVSTLLLHSFTAGLVGWALVSAWSQRRYLRLLLTYALAVFIHGLWNGMAVLSIVPSLQSISNLSISASLLEIGNLSYYGIIILGVIVLVLYIAINNILRHQARVLQVPSLIESGTPDHTQDTLPTGEDENNHEISEYGNSPLEESENTHQAPDHGTDHPTTGEK